MVFIFVFLLQTGFSFLYFNKCNQGILIYFPSTCRRRDTGVSKGYRKLPLITHALLHSLETCHITRRWSTRLWIVSILVGIGWVYCVVMWWKKRLMWFIGSLWKKGLSIAPSGTLLWMDVLVDICQNHPPYSESFWFYLDSGVRFYRFLFW